MVIYEVNLAIDASVADKYAAWLGPHIEEVLAVEGFASADWWIVEPDGEDTSQVRWCVQYHVESRIALAAYFRDHAGRLRGNGLARFGGQFTASRRVLLPRGSYPPQ